MDRLDTVPPHLPDLLPHLWGVPGPSDVDQEVSEHRHLQVQVQENLDMQLSLIHI